MSFSPTRPVPGSTYLLNRAEAEIQMAEQAKGETAAQAHHVLASSYLALVFGEVQEGARRTQRGMIAAENRQAMIAPLRGLGDSFAEAEPPTSDDFADLLEKIQA